MLLNIRRDINTLLGLTIYEPDSLQDMKEIPMPRPEDENVTILMGVHNGAAHLTAQLGSIAGQSFQNWTLRCSDDGSTDRGPQIITEFSSGLPGQITLTTGPCSGFSDNYIHLMRGLGAQTGPVAFADQDDVWGRDKLQRGLDALSGLADRPALYCARRWLWVPETDHRHLSRALTRPCGFRNALIENVASGNTIVLNKAAARLARMAAQRTKTSVFAHDWWLYLLITGAGGQVVFDHGPACVLYRQHGNNAIGGRRGISAQIRRKSAVLKGAFARRISQNITALEQISDLLTADARRVLCQFDQARQAILHRRLALLHRVAPYRQTSLGTFGFWGAAGLGKI
jgi:glycosyltransferase involved in cell wall biosynthesis